MMDERLAASGERRRAALDAGGHALDHVGVVGRRFADGAVETSALAAERDWRRLPGRPARKAPVARCCELRFRGTSRPRPSKQLRALRSSSSCGRGLLPAGWACRCVSVRCARKRRGSLCSGRPSLRLKMLPHRPVERHRHHRHRRLAHDALDAGLERVHLAGLGDLALGEDAHDLARAQLLGDLGERALHELLVLVLGRDRDGLAWRNRMRHHRRLRRCGGPSRSARAVRTRTRQDQRSR